MLGTLAITAAAKAMKLRQYGVICASLGAFLGAFLTIAVSGVFFLDDVQQERLVGVRLADWFSSGGDSNSFAGECSNECILLQELDTETAAGLILESGLSFPPWTYDDLAFPQLEIINVSQGPYNDSLLKVHVPAIRSNLECFYQTKDNLTDLIITLSSPAQMGLPSQQHISNGHSQRLTGHDSVQISTLNQSQLSSRRMETSE
jgi:hypothetical protein